MKRHGHPFGIAAALVTPFDPGGRPDQGRLVRHASDLLARGCSGIGLFGTTGEGPSVGLRERTPVLQALAAAGIGGDKLVYGVAVTAVDDALAHARLAADFGCRRLLVTPPFYYPGVDAGAVRDWFAAFLGPLPEGTEVILYNIPQVTGVPVPVETVRALRDQFPAIVTGVKDSAGDWENTRRLLAAFPDLDIMIGDERLLERGVALGASGSITGVANFRPETLTAIMAGHPADPAIVPLVNAIVALPVTPAIKVLVGHATGDRAWRAVRPPFSELSDSDAATLIQTTDALFARAVA